MVAQKWLTVMVSNVALLTIVTKKIIIYNNNNNNKDCHQITQRIRLFYPHRVLNGQWTISDWIYSHSHRLTSFLRKRVTKRQLKRVFMMTHYKGRLPKKSILSLTKIFLPVEEEIKGRLSGFAMMGRGNNLRPRQKMKHLWISGMSLLEKEGIKLKMYKMS